MRVFIAHSFRDRDTALAIGEFLTQQGHEVLSLRPDAAADIQSQVAAALHAADAVVAVLSGANPNVLFELGFAMGAGRSVLVVSKSDQEVPADLVSLPYVQTTGDPRRDAQEVVRRVAQFPVRQAPAPLSQGSAETTLYAALENPELLETLSPAAFEELLRRLFRERGFQVRRADRPERQAFDFEVHLPRRGWIPVEVKKTSRQNRVPVEAVRRFAGSMLMMGAMEGLLVATSGFTSAALGFAAGLPIALRTIEEILRAKHPDELTAPPAVAPN